MIDFMVKLQEFRTPLLNKIVELITISAEEITLIIIICIIFWCISKEKGYKIFLSVILASSTNAALKLMFNVDRPWVKDDRIIPIRQETATGSSLPSGHTQTGGSMWFSLSRSFSQKWIKIFSYIMIGLIAISRVYLSVHTPLDVCVSIVLLVLVVLLSHFIIDRAVNKKSLSLLIMLAVLSFIGLFFLKNESYYKMSGLLLAFPITLFIENKYIRFSTKAKWWKQILKIVIGFATVLVFKEGLKLILPDTLIFNLIRYFFVGVGVICIAPLIFVATKLSEKES